MKCKHALHMGYVYALSIHGKGMHSTVHTQIMIEWTDRQNDIVVGGASRCIHIWQYIYLQ